MNKYIQKFKENHPNYYKDYYQRNKEKIIKAQQKRYHLHREEIIKYATEYGKKYHKKYPWRKTLKNIRQRCYYKLDRKYEYYGGKGIECYLTLKQIRYLWERDKANLMQQPSIDRIDGKGHYSIDNCQFIEMIENRNKKTP